MDLKSCSPRNIEKAEPFISQLTRTPQKNSGELLTTHMDDSLTSLPRCAVRSSNIYVYRFVPGSQFFNPIFFTESHKILATPIGIPLQQPHNCATMTLIQHNCATTSTSSDISRCFLPFIPSKDTGRKEEEEIPKDRRTKKSPPSSQGQDHNDPQHDNEFGLDHMRLPFPYKLHILLCDMESTGQEHIISWVEHGKAFKIHDQKKFETSIQPRYFRQSKIASFIRQVSIQKRMVL